MSCNTLYLKKKKMKMTCVCVFVRKKLFFSKLITPAMSYQIKSNKKKIHVRLKIRK